MNASQEQGGNVQFEVVVEFERVLGGVQWKNNRICQTEGRQTKMLRYGNL